MYTRFEELLKARNMRAADVSRITGIHSAVFSEWKKGKSTPKQDKLLLIANALGVSIEYLMTGKEPTTENMYDEEFAHLVGKIRNDAELSKALLKYFELSEVKKKHVVETINLLSEVGK